MSRYVDPLILESDQKDLMISELKAENFELRNKEKHYNQMYNIISNIEHECALISEEKRAMEEEMRRRNDADSITIRRLREENEALILAHRDHDKKLAAIRDEIARMRAVNDSKSREIGDLNASVNYTSDNNNGLRDKIKDVEKFIVRECDEGRGLRLDLAKTNDSINSRDHEIDDLNKRIKRHTIDIGDRGGNLRDLEGELVKLNDGIGKGRHDLDKLRCRLDDEVERNHRLKDENGALLSEGADLSAHIREVEAKCTNRDAQISVMRNEIDKLSGSLEASEACNRNLEDELDALNRHSERLHHQNLVLNDELADAIVGEDFVKKEKIAIVKQDNEDQIRHSLTILSEAKARSPIRKR